MKKRITFTDVARKANVSLPTVSRVATGSAIVSPEIEKRVRRAAQSLGIDFSGRCKSQVVVFLLSNRERLHPFHARVLFGAELYCAERGFNVLFVSHRYPLTLGWKDLHLPRVCERRKIACGFILSGVNSPALLKRLSHKGILYSVLGNNVVGEWRQEDHDVVSVDDVRGGYEMTHYLQSIGHQAIWFVGNCRLPWISNSYAGYRRAMLEASLVPRLQDLALDRTEQVGYLGTKSILARHDPITAIFVGDPDSAHGACRALRDSGLRIPDDVSVAGVGDTEPMLYEHSLTTVREFPEQVGSDLARLVLNRLAEPHGAPQQVMVPIEIVPRESCARPPLSREIPQDAKLDPNRDAIPDASVR